jgi:1-acyl-sn-glycerol-3-phosphate acyltransferase
VVHAGADLEEGADEGDFVADGFEEELFEEVARFEPVAGVEVAEGFVEAGVVFERREEHAPIVVTLRAVFRAAVIVLLLIFNLAFWATLVLSGGLVKLLTWGRVKGRIIRVLAWFGERWVACNDRIFDSLLDTKWVIEGVNGLRHDGHYLIISNHVSWIDILALFRAFHGKAPLMRFFLKQQLAWAPFVGQAAWALDFPFMKRYSPEYLKQHPEKRGADLLTTRRACRRYRHIPVSILNFVEGTRFDPAKHAEQQSPYRHLLRPRIGGISFVVASMAKQLDAMYDVTLVYPRRDVTFLDFIMNRVPWIRVEARRLEIPHEFHNSAITNPGEPREQFKQWVETLWAEKDRRIGEILNVP